MDKHLLAENPMRSPEGGLCIIRTVDPVAIFQIHEGHKNVLGKYHKHYTFVSEVKEKFTLSIHHYFSKDFDLVNDEDIYKRMDEAWHWFMAYMKFEDQRKI